MGYYDVKCPQCGEVNLGSRLICIKCQTNLIGIHREQTTPAPIDVSEIPDKLISRPLRVLGNRRDLLGGALGCIVAIIFYFKGTPDIAAFVGTLGIALLLISWDWVEATHREITVHKILHSTTILWKGINKIYTINNLGIIFLIGDENSITLYPARWAGQDKEQMFQLFDSKIIKTGIQPEEYRFQK